MKAEEILRQGEEYKQRYSEESGEDDFVLV